MANYHHGPAKRNSFHDESGEPFAFRTKRRRVEPELTTNPLAARVERIPLDRDQIREFAAMFASEEKIRKVFPDYIKDYMAAQVAAFHDTFQPKDGQLNDRYYEVEGAIVDAVLDPKGVNAPLMKMRDTGSQFALVMSKVKAYTRGLWHNRIQFQKKGHIGGHIWNRISGVDDPDARVNSLEDRVGNSSNEFVGDRRPSLAARIAPVGGNDGQAGPVHYKARPSLASRIAEEGRAEPILPPSPPPSGPNTANIITPISGQTEPMLFRQSSQYAPYQGKEIAYSTEKVHEQTFQNEQHGGSVKFVPKRNASISGEMERGPTLTVVYPRPQQVALATPTETQRPPVAARPTNSGPLSAHKQHVVNPPVYTPRDTQTTPLPPRLPSPETLRSIPYDDIFSLFKVVTDEMFRRRRDVDAGNYFLGKLDSLTKGAAGGGQGAGAVVKAEYSTQEREFLEEVGRDRGW